MKLRFGQKLAALAGIWLARKKIKKLLIQNYWSRHAVFPLEFAGIKATFSTEDFYSNYWFYGPQMSGMVYEPAVTSLLVERLPNARAFADVGANLGYFTVVAGVARPGLPIFTFEMDHTLRPIIERNLELNHIETAIITNAAVGARAGSPVEFVPHPFSFLGKIAQESIEPYPLTLTTETLVLDEFFARQGVLPNLIKMDIDGAEMAALKGMEKILEQDDLIMLLEVHAHHLPSFGTNLLEVQHFLTQRGFSFRKVGDFRDSRTVDLQPLDDFSGLSSPSGDMLLVSRTF